MESFIKKNCLALSSPSTHKLIKIANAAPGTSLTSTTSTRGKKGCSTDPADIKNSGVISGNHGLEAANDKSVKSTSQSLFVPFILESLDSEVQDANKTMKVHVFFFFPH